MKSAASLTVVGHFFDIATAEVACSALNASGIPAFVFDRHFIQQRFSIMIALGGVRVAVPTSHAAEARAFIHQPLDLGPNEDIDDCPECGASCPFRRPSIIAGIIAIYWVWELFILRTRYRKCRQCGHMWKIPKSTAAGFGPACDK